MSRADRRRATSMAKHTGVRTFEMRQYITSYVECESMDDLPSNLQDIVYEALEAIAQEVQLPLAITSVLCDRDWNHPDDTNEDPVWFLLVYASEMIAVNQIGRLH